MGSRAGERLGIIYGEVESTRFRFAASSPDVKRLDYVAAEHPEGGLALGQVVDVQSHSELSLDEALASGRHGGLVAGDQVSATVKVVGFRDERGLLQLPRTPFKAGHEVRRAGPELIQKVLGLTTALDEGVYLGFLRGTDTPVVLDVDLLVQKHVSVLAKTGAGKSYTVGVLIEELLKRRVPLFIVDAHGEYNTLASPNIEPREIDNLIRFGLKPKSFAPHMVEYAIDTELARGGRKLVLDGANLDAHEILDLLSGKVSGAQQGLLYQSINQLKKTKPGYQLPDLVEELGRNPSNAKWPLIAALENLQSTGLFAPTGTGPGELVKAGQATILNLKGAAPPIQEIVVARLARSLFEARKRETVPPFLLVLEEAHNFCPERGLGSAVSGNELRTIASEGRKFGLGLLIVSQRPAKVDKNVLSQCNTQIIMKVTNPNDLKAIAASVEGLTAEVADEIQRLGTGVGLVAGGRLAYPVLVEIRTRQTRHGGKSVSVMVDEELEEPPGTPAPAGAAAAPEATSRPEEPFVNVEEAPPEPSKPAMAAPASAPKTAQAPRPAPTGPRRELRESRVVSYAKAPPWAPGGQLPPPAEPTTAPPAPARVRRTEPPAGPTGAEPPTRLAPPAEANDQDILRVVNRIGYASARTPREALVRLRELAHDVPTLTGDDYVRAFARIAQTYCYPAGPECGPCPLLRRCRLGSERLARGEVREGRWGRRAP